MSEHNPLDERLRATFAAERADIERRLLASGTTSTHDGRSRTVQWIPFAVAAALIAVAGFVFIGNRSSDTAVELDIAAQGGQIEREVPNPDAPGNAGPIAVSTPLPFPGGTFPEPIPFLTGESFCNDFDAARTVVWRSDDSNSPALVEPGNGVNSTREILSGTPVTLVGGCTSAGTSQGPKQWYEIAGLANTTTEWVESRYLITQDDYNRWITEGIAPPVPTPMPDFGTPVAVPVPPPPSFTPSVPPSPNECAQPAIPVVFVWDIAVDDPDGGLVAHTEPDVDAPATRILRLDQVVSPTGNCRLSPTGSPWYELINPADNSTDWASARYLNGEGRQACLRGEPFGTRSRTSAPRTHYVQAGDFLSAIARSYGVTLDSLLAANPAMDPGLIIVGEALWIPGMAEVPEQIVGPIDGLAILDGDKVAFTGVVTPGGSTSYRWYPADAVSLDQSCVGTPQSPLPTPVVLPGTNSFGEGPTGSACVYGQFRLFMPNLADPILTGQGPQSVDLTGRTHPGMSSSTDAVEVTFATADGQFYVGLIDPFVDTIEPGQCNPPTTGGDSLADVGCTAGDSDVVVGTTERGSAASNADYVHNIRVEQALGGGIPCTRIVIELGDPSTRAPADLIPLVTILKNERATRVQLPGGSFGDLTGTSRVRFYNGVALLATLGIDRYPVVEVIYGQAGPVNVWFLEQPARVIIDHLAPPPQIGVETQPFGESTVLRQPIQTELFGPGILQGQSITVQGFGRPFESEGQYRIYQVPADTDALTYFETERTPLHTGRLRTSGWIAGWGEFQIELPQLEPGSYIALFGEQPPNDDGPDFVGTGQLFRVAAPDDPTAPTYPPAVILPNVQIG